MPVCTGARPVYDRTLFWRTERAAARVGSWKYLEDKDGEHLFDLSVDPGEKNDRRAQQPTRSSGSGSNTWRGTRACFPGRANSYNDCIVKVARIAAVLLLAATSAPSAQTSPPSPMNTIAEQYVKLVLALGQHDADYVDAFYGPPEWKTDAGQQKMPLATSAWERIG